jgi:hypothetical protein
VTPAPVLAHAPIPLTHKKVASGAIAAKEDFAAVTGEIPPVKRAPTPGPITSLALEPTLQVKVDVDGTPLELPPARRVAPAPAVALHPPLDGLSAPSPSFEAPSGDALSGEAPLSAPSGALAEALSDAPPAPLSEPSGAALSEPLSAGLGAALSKAASEASFDPPPAGDPPPELPPLREALPEPPPREAPRPIVRAGKTPIPARVTPAAAFDAVEADFFAREADLYKREAVDTFDDLDSGGKRDPRPPSSSPKSHRKRR